MVKKGDLLGVPLSPNFDDAKNSATTGHLIPPRPTEGGSSGGENGGSGGGSSGSGEQKK